MTRRGGLPQQARPGRYCSQTVRNVDGVSWSSCATQREAPLLTLDDPQWGIASVRSSTCPIAGHRDRQRAGLRRRASAHLSFATRRCFGRAGRRARAGPTIVAYRLIFRPGLAEIVGDGRPWTVLMVSLLSIPWG